MKKLLIVSTAVLLVAALFGACSKTPKLVEPVAETPVQAVEVTAEPASLKLTVTAPEGWGPHKVNPAIMSKDMGTYQITEDSMLYVFKNGRAYTLTCGTLESDFAGLKSDFGKIIASAKLE